MIKFCPLDLLDRPLTSLIELMTKLDERLVRASPAAEHTAASELTGPQISPPDRLVRRLLKVLPVVQQDVRSLLVHESGSNNAPDPLPRHLYSDGSVCRVYLFRPPRPSARLRAISWKGEVYGERSRGVDG